MVNMDLFPEPRRLRLADADVVYHTAPDLGLHPDDLFRQLRQELPWEQHNVLIQGREIAQPRLSSWHGEVMHKYSSLAHMLVPQPWSDALNSLRARIEAITGSRFNSMLANLYRDGNDAIGWHADNEPELGPQPVIASLSLGASRRFDMRHRDAPGKVERIMLEHGSLLVMGGQTQSRWQHSIARTAAPTAERINLTFRLTLPALEWRRLRNTPGCRGVDNHLV